MHDWDVYLEENTIDDVLVEDRWKYQDPFCTTLLQIMEISWKKNLYGKKKLPNVHHTRSGVTYATRAWSMRLLISDKRQKRMK